MRSQYYLECQFCPERIALPTSGVRQSISEESLDRSYWPGDGHFARFVCPSCGHAYRYSYAQICRTVGEGSAHHSSLLWKATLECSHENCREIFNVHTPSSADALKSQAARAVLHAKPALLCPAGHEIIQPRHFEIELVG